MNKKTLRWNFIFQYGWVLTNIFNSILLLPIYIKNIDKGVLGVWLATSSILSWMTLIDPGIGDVLQQKIAELRGKKQLKVKAGSDASNSELVTDFTEEDNSQEIGKSIGSGFIGSAFILLFSIIVGIICYFSVGLIINKDISQYPNLSVALLITIISTGMSLVSFTLSGINQGMHNAAHVAISSLSANFLFLIVNLVLLYAKLGVMSIALANLCRALFINGFNILSLLQLLKKEGLSVIYNRPHFKKFIRIFSFTSASKIITGLAGSMDMLVLARYIPPQMITLYELNKRPINFTNTLIGRHSVALMPLLSHAKGTGDRPAVTSIIHKQFKIYVYISLLAAFMFVINYEDLITLWAGKENFMGYTVLYLLTIYSFLGLVAYFMSNMSYALGDIKKNSQFNIIRNLLFGVMVFFAAKLYGIIGTLTISVGLVFVADFFYFGYRVYKMGYLDITLLRKSAGLWFVVIAASTAVAWGCKLLNRKLMPEGMHLSKMMIGSTLFIVFYVLFLLSADTEMRNLATQTRNKILYNPLVRRVRTGIFNGPGQ